MENNVRRSVAIFCQLMLDNAALMVQVALHGEQPSTVERFAIGEAGKFLSIYDKYTKVNIFTVCHDDAYTVHHPHGWMNAAEAECIYKTAHSAMLKMKSAEVEYEMLPEDMKIPLPTPAEKSFIDLYSDFK
ncbi:hypothetical protein [Burkholderia pseudomallei]|uniref:hypothetical protein n=1 Tax=Burkholderia pseudomallei TaxID=28450 RepID=UPI001060F0CD|nr:hypothetical protein [Burkholderia pseudomallei]